MSGRSRGPHSRLISAHSSDHDGVAVRSLGRRSILPIHCSCSAFSHSAASASALILPFRYFLPSSLMPPRGICLFATLRSFSHTDDRGRPRPFLLNCIANSNLEWLHLYEFIFHAPFSPSPPLKAMPPLGQPSRARAGMSSDTPDPASRPRSQRRQNPPHPLFPVHAFENEFEIPHSCLPRFLKFSL